MLLLTLLAAACSGADPAPAPPSEPVASAKAPITAGKPALDGPDNVFALDIPNTDNNGLDTLCTGSLITPAWVLTAAHCFNGDAPIGSKAQYKAGSIIAMSNAGVADFYHPTAVYDEMSKSQQKGIAVWSTDKPMDFTHLNESQHDLALVPLSKRLSITPVTLPFGPTGSVIQCGSDFPGEYYGYGGTGSLIGAGEASGVRNYADAEISLAQGPLNSNGDVYKVAFSWDSYVFGFVPGLSDIIALLNGSTYPNYVLSDGDSGGPLFSQSFYGGNTLCGANSARLPTFNCVPDLPPLPLPVHCDIAIENHYPRVDSSDAAAWIRSHIVDKLGHFKGECNGDGPASLQNTDTDGDGMPDACDPCPYLFDPDYMPTGDVGDTFKTDLAHDYDQDGVPDVCDNCPTVKNPYVFDNGKMVQADTDKDGVGDACDSCPYSDVRRAQAKHYAGDFKCCATDADCGNADHVGRQYNVLTANLCMPLEYPTANLEADMSWPAASDVPHCASGKHCSDGADSDGDGTSDTCDNCPGLSNDQSDADGDGVGDACDNCKGDNDYPDPQHHQADRNDVSSMECDANGVPDALGEAKCKSLNSDPHSVCVPGKIVGGVLKPAYCSKFPDSDYPTPDGIGDACDNCPDVPNSYETGKNMPNGISPGTLNGQPNCNLLAEVAGGMAYPYIGDACDPSPCNRPFRNGGLQYPPDWADDGTHGDLWAIVSYDPQILPDSYKASFRSPETPFNNAYTGTPVATVGARVCDCPRDPNTGMVRNAWQCHTADICQIKPILYNYQDAGLPPDQDEWREMKTWKQHSTDLQASPLTPPKEPNPSLIGGSFAFNGELSNLALEAAAGTTPTTTGANPDNLSPFLQSPTYVAWDLTASGAGEQGVVYGYGIVGVFWTAVRDVPQVLPGTPAGTAKPFTDWSNKYSSGYIGVGGPIAGYAVTKSTCPFCDMGGCPYCRKRICMACLASPEARSLVISPAAGRVYAQTSGGAIDITNEFSAGALEAMSATGTRWVTSAERGGWIGANGVAFSVLSTDGTTVEATLVAGANETEGVTLLGGGRIVGRPQGAGAIPIAGSPSPPPRSDFGAVLSGHEQAVFVIGGELQGGGLAGDLWMYDLTDSRWSQLPFTGPAPEKVIASTYIPDTRSLYVVDQTDENPVLARLLRYDFATGAFVELGQWPRTVVFDRVELSGSYEGNLLLSGSSKLTNHVAGVVLRPSADKVQVIGAFLRKGVLAVEPTLGATALTLPLVSDSSSGSTNTVIPTSEVFFPTHEKPQHKPKGPPCNDYRCPPHLTIGDVL